MTGGEVSVRSRVVGLTIRVFQGDLSASSGTGGGGELVTAEARLQVGPRIAAAEGGYARRAVGGRLGTTVYSYVRAGLASIADIGASGFSARLSAAVYLAGQGVPGATVGGHEVTTALEYRLRRLPLALAVGYRGEVFEAKGDGVDRSESVGGIIAGVGLRLAR